MYTYLKLLTVNTYLKLEKNNFVCVLILLHQLKTTHRQKYIYYKLWTMDIFLKSTSQFDYTS